MSFNERAIKAGTLANEQGTILQFSPETIRNWVLGPVQYAPGSKNGFGINANYRFDPENDLSFFLTQQRIELNLFGQESTITHVPYDQLRAEGAFLTKVGNQNILVAYYHADNGEFYTYPLTVITGPTIVTKRIIQNSYNNKYRIFNPDVPHLGHYVYDIPAAEIGPLDSRGWVIHDFDISNLLQTLNGRRSRGDSISIHAHTGKSPSGSNNNPIIDGLPELFGWLW